MRLIHPLFTVVLVFVCSCSLNKFTANTTANLFVEASETFNQEHDLTLAKESMPANLKMIEGLQKVSPENQTILTMLAKGYCSYSFAFLEDNEKPGDLDRAKSLYVRGYKYGLNALDEDVKKSTAASLQEMEKTIKEVSGDEDVASLFWTAYCISSWINLSKNDVSAIAELSRAELMMRQVLKEEEEFYYGSAHLFFGVYYGSRPKMLGGDPLKAKEHLEKAIMISNGKFLLSKLYFAQFYAVPTQQEELFERTLKEILEAPIDLLPEERLANQVAKKRALKLLNIKNRLF